MAEASALETRQHRTLEVRSSTFRRTPEGAAVDVVFSTFEDVRRYDWDGPYIERLYPDGLDLTRLNSGAPVLKDHRVSTEAQVGVVVEGSARIVNGVAVATVLFSDAPEHATFIRDVERGIRRQVSFGYEYLAFDWSLEEPVGRVLNVKRFAGYEISFTPIGADSGAQVRTKEQTMQSEDRARVAGIVRYALEACAVRKLRVEGIQETVDKLVEAGTALEAARAVIDEAIAALQGEDSAAADAEGDGGTMSNDTTSTGDEARSANTGQAAAVVAAERARARGIRSAARALRLGDDVAEALVDKGVSLDAAREQLFELAAKRSDAHGVSSVHAGDTEGEKVGREVEAALLHRIDPGRYALKGRNDFRGLSLVELGRDMLSRRGTSTRGLGRDAVAHLMLRAPAGSHVSSDFPYLLANVANKVLRDAYEEEPRSFLPFVNVVFTPDFKTRSVVQLSEAADLEEILEGDDIKLSTFSESREQYALRSWGTAAVLSRRMVINDDLAAFGRVPRLFGAAAARKESDLVYGQITGNPTMGDGTALFHANHDNLLTGASGAVPSAAALGAAMAALELQTGINGARLNLRPRFILCPVAQRLTWERILAHTDTATVANTPTASQRALDTIADSRLDADSSIKWYLAAAPSQVDTIEVAYLEGNAAPRVNTDEIFLRPGVTVKIEHDCAAKVIDYRAFQRNDGVAS